MQCSMPLLAAIRRSGIHTARRNARLSIAVAEQKKQEKKEEKAAHEKKKTQPEFSYNPLPEIFPNARVYYVAGSSGAKSSSRSTR